MYRKAYAQPLPQLSCQAGWLACRHAAFISQLQDSCVNPQCRPPLSTRGHLKIHQMPCGPEAAMLGQLTGDGPLSVRKPVSRSMPAMSGIPGMLLASSKSPAFEGQLSSAASAEAVQALLKAHHVHHKEQPHPHVTPDPNRLAWATMGWPYSAAPSHRLLAHQSCQTRCSNK